MGRGTSKAGGGAGGRSIERKIENDAHNGSNADIEKIRNAKTENLIVYDKQGNIIHTEGGVLNHTGMAGFSDYKDTVAVHNHPKGIAPYPSGTDFDTYREKGISEMIIVSPTNTVSLKKDPNFKGAYRGDIRYTAEYIMGGNSEATRIRQEWRKSGERGAVLNERLKKHWLDTYQKAAKREGYILTVTEIKKRKK